jgi:hypothetical protein|tara:strand:- start:3439 stop:3672 length:234 start_codon:yes stop_codon:yes gene_type:complete
MVIGGGLFVGAVLSIRWIGLDHGHLEQSASVILQILFNLFPFDRFLDGSGEVDANVRYFVVIVAVGFVLKKLIVDGG